MTKAGNSESNGLKKYLVGVAVTLTIGFLIQAGTLIWWCSEMDTSMEYIKRDVSALAAAVGACCP